MSRRKAKVRPSAKLRKQLQTLKDGVSSAVKRLDEAREDLHEANSFVFVCIQALRTRTGDDVVPDVAAVLSMAYDKLALDVDQHLRDAIEALDQDGAP